MAKEAAVAQVSQNETFDQWRIKTNLNITKGNNQEDKLGDLALLENGEADLTSAVNNARDYAIAMSIALGQSLRKGKIKWQMILKMDWLSFMEIV